MPQRGLLGRNSDRRDQLSELRQSRKAAHHVAVLADRSTASPRPAKSLEVPITGGNVSFYNETLGEGIYPTPVLGIVGMLEDVHKTAKMDFREAGRTIVLLRGTEPGDITDAESEFGSSEYAKEILGAVWGYPPELELEQEAALQKGLIEMIQAGWWSRRMTVPRADWRSPWPSLPSRREWVCGWISRRMGCRRNLRCLARMRAG